MKEVIDFKIGDEYKEGDILNTRQGVYLLVEKSILQKVSKMLQIVLVLQCTMGRMCAN